MRILFVSNFKKKYKDKKRQFQELCPIQTVTRMTYVPTKWRGVWTNIVQNRKFQSQTTDMLSLNVPARGEWKLLCIGWVNTKWWSPRIFENLGQIIIKYFARVCRTVVYIYTSIYGFSNTGELKLFIFILLLLKVEYTSTERMLLYSYSSTADNYLMKTW